MVKLGVREREGEGVGQFRMELAVIVKVEKPAGLVRECFLGDCRTGGVARAGDSFLGVVCWRRNRFLGERLGDGDKTSSPSSGLYSFLGLGRS